jgi:hypothetical protein
MRRAERQTLPIAFRKRVRKPHHAMRIATVIQAIRVAKFVDRFGGGTLKEQAGGILT